MNSRGWGVGIALANLDKDIVKKTATNANLGLGIDLSDTMSLVVNYETQLSNSSNLEDIDISASGIVLWFKKNKTAKSGLISPRYEEGY